MILESGWCYAMCDSIILPLLSISAFGWTIYQEYRHQRTSQ